MSVTGINSLSLSHLNSMLVNDRLLSSQCPGLHMYSTVSLMASTSGCGWSCKLFVERSGGSMQPTQWQSSIYQEKQNNELWLDKYSNHTFFPGSHFCSQVHFILCSLCSWVAFLKRLAFKQVYLTSVRYGVAIVVMLSQSYVPPLGGKGGSSQYLTRKYA